MIFNLFKSKPTLNELIPKGFVDIHSHILPGIDDGAKNIEESLNMINKIKEMGFSKIIGTPHTYQGLYNNTNESIKNSFNLVKKNLKENIEIDYASEYLLDYSLIEKAEKGVLLAIKGKYILVEMSYLGPSLNLDEILHKIIAKGYIPILAHPERYSYYYRLFNQYYKLKKIGCLFQLNLLSAVGYYGKDSLMITNKLLENNLVDFLGSDIHNIIHLKNFEKKIKIKENLINNFERIIENNFLLK